MKKEINKLHELLLPAGSYEKAIYALHYGADAIYIGPKAYSLRSRSSNFDIDDISKITEYAHKINKKVYVVLNIICHNADIKNFENYFKKISKTNIDGIIVADPFIFSSIKKISPNLDLHVSTQQSITNSKACLFWKRNKATRIVLGREVSYSELEKILANLKNEIEIEYFIHGAVCISYSGRCMMSNNFSLRDANVGGCAQSCRWKYKVINSKEPLEKYFTMSAKDMELLNDMDKLLKLDIASFKIEGRMKSIHYVATVANCYRKYIDLFKQQKNIDLDQIKLDLEKSENREADNAWFDGNPNSKKMLYFELEKQINQIFAFNFVSLEDNGLIKIMSRNYFSKDNSFELMYPNFERKIIKIQKIYDEKMQEIDVVKTPMKYYFIKVDKEIIFNKYVLGRTILKKH